MRRARWHCGASGAVVNNPIANLYTALADAGMGPLAVARAEEAEPGVVTLFNGKDVAIGWVERGDFDQIRETLAKRERDRVAYRGPFGDLRPVPR